MPKIKCSKQLANNPRTPAPRFNFTEYAINRKYHNNPQEIDFVVYNGSLYVCTEDDVYAQKSNIEEQSGFLCVVRKGDDGRRGADGRDGRPGPIPEIGAKFEGTQLVIYEKNGTRLSSSPDLTGPAWIPVLNEDETAITWTDDQTAVPSDIPLNKILPRNEYPVLFRLNSDNTRRSDENETGPGYYIQWKREGAEEWTNLMSISELMNLALAGVSFWEETDESDLDATGQPKKYIHFGHKQVIKATYDASKLGNNRIAEVVLGDVLFDAGRVPFPEMPDYSNLFALIQADIRNVKLKIEALRALIPTKLSQLENDVPYIRSINGQRPDNNGDFTLEDLIGGDGTVKSVNYNYPDENGNVSLNIPGGTVKSVNNELPDANGNVTVSLGNLVDLTPYVKKSDLIKINNHLLYGGEDLNLGGLNNIDFRVNCNSQLRDSNNCVLEYRTSEDGETWSDWIYIMDVPSGGVIEGGDGVGIDGLDFKLEGNELKYQVSIEGVLQDWQTIPLPSGITGDGVGIDNIEFRLTDDDELQYRVSINGVLQNWIPIALPEGTSGGGERISLTIHDGNLYISRNGGAEELVGPVGNVSGNWVKNITKSNNTLVITYWDNTTNTINLPEGGGSTVVVQPILAAGTNTVHIATITVNGQEYKIYAPKSSGTTPVDPDDPDQPVTPTEPSYRTFMVYQRTNSPSEAPATNTITEATWNLSTQELDLTSQYWHNHPGNATGVSDSCLWMTSATFSSEYGARVTDWEDPICLTSRFGDGADSNLKEFIYRSVKESEYEAVKAVRPVGRYDTDQDSTNDNQDDNIPPSDQLAERQWLDNPVGITPEYPYELCSYRRKVDGVWSQYSMPFVWSRWGEDGVDGDGVEYVFRRAVADEVDETDGSITLKATVTRPDNAWDDDSAVAPWTDDPSGVNATNPYEFCSQRKTKIVTDQEGKKSVVWDDWSEPALWSIYKEGPQGPQGPGGGPGPAGPRGDDYEKVYGLAGNSLPSVKSIDATGTDANEKTSVDDGYLPKFVFDGVSVDATATPQGVSATNRYEFESIRRKHDGVWGPFSAPALHSNFVEAGLTEEQLNNIKNDVKDAIDSDLDDAKERLTNAETRLNAIDGPGSSFFQDNTSSIVSILTNYKDTNQTSFADLILDGSQAEITLQAAAQTAEGLSNVQTDMNAVKGIIGNYADYSNGQGGYNTVKSLLDSKAATATVSAIQEDVDQVNAAMTKWDTDKATLQSSVMTAQYVWQAEDGSVLEYTADDATNNRTTKTSGGKTYTRVLVSEAMSAIRQSAGEVDIIANWGDDTWAQIIAKATEETGSSIILEANNIDLQGTTNATTAVIGNATITDASITDGTITNAIIDNCTINSVIQSDDYSGTNKTGFLIDPEAGDFAFYADNAKFDSDNGLVFSGNQTISWANVTGKPTIPSDVSDLTDNSDLIPSDVSDLTDTSHKIPTDLSQLTDNTNVITTTIGNTYVKTNDLFVNGKIDANLIDADQIHATVASFDYLTVGGEPIGQGNALDIEFGDASATIPVGTKNTIYFLY